jgi:hypothetical protein
VLVSNETASHETTPPTFRVSHGKIKCRDEQNQVVRVVDSDAAHHESTFSLSLVDAMSHVRDRCRTTVYFAPTILFAMTVASR